MWRRYLFFLLVFLAVMAPLAWLFQDQQHASIAAHLAGQAKQEVVSHSRAMEQELVSVRDDLSYLASMPELSRFMSVVSDGPLTEMRDRLVQAYQHFTGSRQRYDQLRLLDLEGRELIRVALDKGVGVNIPDHQLVSHEQHPFFRRSINGDVGEIDVSPLELNRVNSEVELPYKPVIRLAVPVANSAGEKSGLLVISYLGSGLLQWMTAFDRTLPGKSVLLNGRGEYLTSFVPDQAWGFMFEEGKQDQFALQYPAIWQQIQSSSHGQLSSARGGIYTFSHLAISDVSSAGCRECDVVILHQMSYDELEAAHLAEFRKTLPVAVITLLLITLGSIALFWNMQQRHLTKKHLTSLHRRIERERDVFTEGPAVIFRWHNAFGWPVDYVSENLYSVFGYSPADFSKEQLGLASIIEPAHLETMNRELEAGLKSGQPTFSRSPFSIIDRDGQHRWVSDTVRVVRNGQGKVVELYSYVTDISRLKAAERELEKSRIYVQKVVDTIADPTLVLDISDYRVTSANQAAYDTYVPKQPLVTGLTCYQFSHKTDRPCASEEEPCPIKTILETRQSATVVHRHYDSKGLPFYVEIHATPILDEEGNVTQIVESHRDVTHHLENQRILKQQATTDPLTGAFNRTQFEVVLEQQIFKAAQGGRQLGLIMFDLDHFKQVNDTHGHDVGDLVLKGVVDLVTAHIRQYDLLARWGGGGVLYSVAAGGPAGYAGGGRDYSTGDCTLLISGSWTGYCQLWRHTLATRR